MYPNIRLALAAVTYLTTKARADPGLPNVFNISSFQASATNDNKIKFSFDLKVCPGCSIEHCYATGDSALKTLDTVLESASTCLSADVNFGSFSWLRNTDGSAMLTVTSSRLSWTPDSLNEVGNWSVPADQIHVVNGLEAYQGPEDLSIVSLFEPASGPGQHK